MTEFVAGDNFMPNGTMTAEELDKLWKDWAVMEQKKRSGSSLNNVNDQGGIGIIYS